MAKKGYYITDAESTDKEKQNERRTASEFYMVEGDGACGPMSLDVYTGSLYPVVSAKYALKFWDRESAGKFAQYCGRGYNVTHCDNLEDVLAAEGNDNDTVTLTHNELCQMIKMHGCKDAGDLARLLNKRLHVLAPDPEE